MAEMKFDFVSECGTAAESELDGICGRIEADYMLLMYTAGTVKCGSAGKIHDTKHLLEARLFGKNAELKIMRATISGEFGWRIIDDEKFKAKCDGSSFDRVYDNCVLNETHYLDIDSNKTDSSSNEYIATGGGSYFLPESGLDRVLIRDYIYYDDNGIANIADFRIVKFLKAGEAE